MADFFWKRHDTSQIKTQLLDENKQPVNLSGASVKFVMTAPGAGSPKINAAATIITAVTGIVGFKPASSSDTDTSGPYNAEWPVTFADSTVTTFPNDGNDTVLITDDLDDA